MVISDQGGLKEEARLSERREFRDDRYLDPPPKTPLRYDTCRHGLRAVLHVVPHDGERSPIRSFAAERARPEDIITTARCAHGRFALSASVCVSRIHGHQHSPAQEIHRHKSACAKTTRARDARRLRLSRSETVSRARTCKNFCDGVVCVFFGGFFSGILFAHLHRHRPRQRPPRP